MTHLPPQQPERPNGPDLDGDPEYDGNSEPVVDVPVVDGAIVAIPAAIP